MGIESSEFRVRVQLSVEDNYGKFAVEKELEVSL
jgi:hypothetical protein